MKKNLNILLGDTVPRLDDQHSWMDSETSLPKAKNVANVEILYLDNLGYGPQGKHTRRQWRAECLENLIAGKEQFEIWQKSWVSKTHTDASKAVFGCKLKYSDGTSLITQGSTFDSAALDFEGQLFEIQLVVNDYKFLHLTVFDCAIFNHGAYFYNVIFEKNCNFFHSIFNEIGYFASTTFGKGGGAYFSFARFNGKAIFFNANFLGQANFVNTKFGEYLSFDQANIVGYGDFAEANFQGIATFKSVTFNEAAVFSGATFYGAAIFTLAIFKRQCHFVNKFNKISQKLEKETSFAETVDFENVTFENVGHFERTRFLNYSPSFRGCKIDTTRLEFSDNSYFPCNEKSEDAIKNISFLKRLSDEHGQSDQALNFNAMELRAKRLQTMPRPPALSFKVITWLYEIVSDYGRSFTRPLVGYGVLLFCTLIFALIHAAINFPKDCNGENWLPLSDLLRKEMPCAGVSPDSQLHLTGYRAAAEYTLYRAAGVLDFSDNGKATDAVARRLFGQSVEPWWMRIWGVFKAIASTALLFLAALGLRNKYRIK